MTEQQKRTDALTELADKYNMSAKDRTKLFILYIEAAQLPPGWVALPETAPQEMLGILCSDDARRTSHSYWQFAKERMAQKYQQVIQRFKLKPTDPDN